jgi:hypothetical protein
MARRTYESGRDEIFQSVAVDAVLGSRADAGEQHQVSPQPLKSSGNDERRLVVAASGEGDL